MKKGLVPRQCWFEAMEEEKKVKRNLSRLIHTFQHIPSDRSGNSLRNLVKEIECFNPPVSSKEVRSFNRNLSHNVTDDKASNLPGRRKGEMKLQTDDSNKQIAIVSTSSKSKNSTTLTPDTNLNEKRKLSYKNETQLNDMNKNTTSSNRSNLYVNKNKPKHDFNDSSVEISPDRKLYNLNKKTPKNKLQKDSSNIQRRQDLSSKCQNKDFLRTEFKMAVKNHQMNKNSNAQTYKKHEVFDKVKSNVMRSTIGQTQLMFSRRIESIVNQNNNTLTTQESNMVKKLTNYWNSVLNNEMDEFKSEISSSRSSIKSSKSHEHLSQEAQFTTSTLNIKSRNMSEIDLTKLKKMDKHSSNSMFNTSAQERGENPDTSTESRHKTDHNYYQFSNTSSTTSIICTKLNNDVELDCDAANKSFKETEESRRSEIEFVVDTNQALVTLERLQRYIKIFPNFSLLSDEICLPRSIKVMISLLTAALSSDQYKHLWIEVSEFELLHNQQLTNNSESNKMLLSLSSQQGGSGDYYMSQCNPKDAIVLPNNNLTQVNNALKYISLCKEVLWTMYTSNPIAWQNCPTGSFGFVYEETIVIENIDSEDSESDEEEEEEVSIQDLISAAVNALRELTNSFLQRFGNYWPNSIEDIVRSVYYTIASGLVWWVIVKEIWYEK